MGGRDAGIADGAELGAVFKLSESDRQFTGQLSVNRSQSTLFLRDDEFFVVHREKDRNIMGMLHDLTKVTLIDCVVLSGPGSGYRGEESYSFWKLNPHYIVSGHRHLDPATEQIANITFRIDDAEQLFYDYDAFSVSLDPMIAIDALVEANSKRVDRTIRTGAEPAIVYFAGEREIASVETKIGTVSVSHNPSINPLSSPRRAAIENQILIDIAFTDPISFDAAIERLLTLNRFIELIGGRTPNIEWSTVTIAEEKRGPPLNIYWCAPNLRDAGREGNTPHPAEILVDAVRHSSQFERVLAAWLANEEARADARMRFSSGYKQQNYFEIDRLVGAANMFDILPDDALPPRRALDDAVAAAKLEARRLFRALPQSDERDSILGALGRLGQQTLRQKIEHRAAIVATGLKRSPKNMRLVIDEAVKCRNHYVHGSAGSFDYDEHWHLVAFLARALEFIFGTSDLLDAGWDAHEWQSRGTSLIHPFHLVLESWDYSVDEIQRLRSGTSHEGDPI